MTFPARLALTVLIAGTDVTDYVAPGEFSISNVLTKQIDTCTLTLEDARLVNPQAWQELVVLDGSERAFGGYIISAEEVEGAATDEDEPASVFGVNYSISASDYSIRLEKVVVKKEFVNMTDAAILAALFAEYLPSEGFDATTHVSAIKTHPRKRFNRLTLLECIQDLAKLAKADFYVDYEKRLHYFEANTETATTPFVLSDDPDKISSMPYFDMSVSKDGAGLVNRVEVLGGNYRSDDTEFVLAGNGADARIILPFKLHAPDGHSSVQIWRNDGDDVTPIWTPLTVLTGYIDQLANPDEVLYYYQEKVIEIDTAWPALEKAVRLFAKYEVPLRTRVKDQASIDHYGLVLDDVIVDDTITDKAVARLAGLAKLAESAMAKTALSLKCNQPGLKAGQVATVVNSTHGINGNYLVQKVSVQASVAGKAEYSIALGTYNPSLIDIMLLLAKNAKPKPIWRDDEVLDELLQAAESISFAEVVDEVASVPPYWFSSDPAVGFDWGFGSFDTVRITLEDRFTTADPAPVASPRTCEPGPGTLTISDPTSKLSITGGALTASGNVGSANPLAYSPTIVRSAGAGYWWRVKLNSGTSLVLLVGMRNTTFAPTTYSFILPDYTLYDNAINPQPGDSFAVGTVYDLVLILRATGAYYFAKGGAYATWTLIWVSGTGTTTPLYPLISAGSASGSWEIRDIQAMTFKGAFETAYGLATYHSASPASGVTGNMTGDAFVHFTWTPQVGETLNLYIRRTDDDNCWIVRCSQAGGTIKLIQRQGGTETERSSKAVTWTAGVAVLIAVRAVGTSISTYTNAVRRNLYSSATFNQTATGLKATGFANGANLAAYPRSAMGAALLELENLVQ